MCPYESYRKPEVENHIDSAHLGVKYPCTKCDKVFNKHNSRREHYRIKHTTPKKTPVNIHCEYCDYSAPHKSRVRKHTNSVHLNIKSYKCEICGMQFSLASTLKGHVDKWLRIIPDTTKIDIYSALQLDMQVGYSYTSENP